MSALCESCVLSGRSLRGGPIPRSEESDRVFVCVCVGVCVCVCHCV